MHVFDIFWLLSWVKKGKIGNVLDSCRLASLSSPFVKFIQNHTWDSTRPGWGIFHIPPTSEDIADFTDVMFDL